MFLVVLLTLIVVFVTQWILKKKKFYKFADSIPMDKPYWLLGHLPDICRKKTDDKLEFLHNTCLKYPKMCNLWLGPALLYVFLNDPSYIQKVLLSPVCLQRAPLYNFLGLGSGLITAKYDVWKNHRKILNYAYTLKMVQSFIPIFSANSKKLVENISTNLGETKEIDILNHSMKCTVDMVCETSLGVEGKSVNLGADALHVVKKLVESIGKRILSPLLYPEAIYRLTTLCKEETETRKTFYARIDEMIKEKREALEEKKKFSQNSPQIPSSENPEEVERNRKFKIFIDLLISDEANFSDSEIRDHVNSLFAAGTETSALQISHTIILLAMHPEIQERAAKEVKETFYSEDVEINYENIMKLEYLEMVIKESLRLCPTIPLIARETLAPITIGETEFPAGAILVMSLYSLHRRTDIWGEHANDFNPDNFLPESVEGRHPYSYIPFSGGQRNCIGYRNAMVALKIVLVHLLRSYKFSTSMAYKDLRFKSDIMLRVIGDYLVSVERRN